MKKELLKDVMIVVFLLTAGIVAIDGVLRKDVVGFVWPVSAMLWCLMYWSNDW